MFSVLSLSEKTYGSSLYTDRDDDRDQSGFNFCIKALEVTTYYYQLHWNALNQCTVACTLYRVLRM